MDPDTCFSMILDSIAGEEWIGAAQHAENLRTWLTKGGFPPGGGKIRHRFHQGPARLADLAPRTRKQPLTSQPKPQVAARHFRPEPMVCCTPTGAR